jgi:hypothetical protein
MRLLNKTLPPMYVARPHVKLGVDVEADVAALEHAEQESIEAGGGAKSEPRRSRNFPAAARGCDGRGGPIYCGDEELSHRPEEAP